MSPEMIAALGTAASGAASAAQAAGSVAKNRRSYKWTKRLYSYQNQFNAEQAQIAYDRQRELLEYQNDYDSPAKQVQRYKEAGLNPAILAGNIGAAGVSAPSVDSTSAAGVGQFQVSSGFDNLSANLSSMIQALGALQSIDQNKALIDSEVAKNNAETKNVDADTVKKGVETTNIEKDTDLKQSSIDLNKEEKNKVIEETNTLKYTLDNLLPERVKEVQESVNWFKQQIKASQQLTPAMVADFNQRVNESISRVNLNKKQEQLLDNQIEKWFEQFNAENNIRKQTFENLKMSFKTQDMMYKVQEDMYNSLYDRFYERTDSKFRKGRGVPSFNEIFMQMYMIKFFQSFINQNTK